MTNTITQKIAERSGIEQKAGETIREYVRRVGEEEDIPKESVNDLLPRLEKIYAPEAEWTEDDEEVFGHFIQSINDNKGGGGGHSTDKNSLCRGETVSVRDGEETNANTVNSGSEGTIDQLSDATIQQQSTDRIEVHGSRNTDASPTRSELYKRYSSGLLRHLVVFWKRMDKRLKHVDYGFIAGIIVIGVYAFIHNLGFQPLVKWDESIYANVAQYMVLNGDWLIPHLYIHPQSGGVTYQPFLEKPPLVFWLQAASMSILGVTRFAARLPIAIFSILSGILVYQFGRDIGDRLVGIVAATVLFTTPIIVTGGHGGRTASTDVPLLFFGTLFIYLTWKALTQNRPNLLPYVGIIAALALLTKGFHAGIFVIAVAPLALNHIRSFISREGAVMVGVTAAISLPWPLYAWIQHGEEFIYQIFTQQVVERATGESFITYSDTLFDFMRYPYFRNFPEFFGIWAFLLCPAAAIAILPDKREKVPTAPLLLVWWASSTIGFFAITGNHGWYIMPAFVPGALLIGIAISKAADGSRLAVAALCTGIIAHFLIGELSAISIIISIGAIGVIGYPYYSDQVRKNLQQDDLKHAQVITPLLVSILLVISLVGIPPMGYYQPEYTDEEQLGLTANEEIPADATIGIEPRLGNVWLFTFFASRHYESAPPNQLVNDPDVRYALATNETISRSTQEYTVLDQTGDIRLVRFDS